MAEDLGEKSEAPTAKRLSDARDRGQVPKSQDMNAVIIMAGAVVTMAMLGPSVFNGITHAMRLSLSIDAMMIGLEQHTSRTLMAILGGEIGMLIAPFFLIMMVVGAAAHLLQTGPVFASKALNPNLNNMNPINGVKKIFGKRMIVKTGLDLGKLLAVVLVTGLMVRIEMPRILWLMGLSIEAGLIEACWIVLRVSAVVLVVLFVLAIFDLIYQRYQHTEDNKMTKQQVKDEHKDSEGDPQTKARRMRVARDVAMQRLNQDVPGADVVVANPTHFSVALRYDPEAMGAPVVVAKGADYLALKIRYIATAHGVPIVERPPLARALYREVEPGEQIPAHHFEAVAELLAYVYRLEGRAATMSESTTAAAAS